MSDGESVPDVFRDIVETHKAGERLYEILKEVKKQIGGAPYMVTEEGRLFMHPLLAKKLNEPGNEGPLEYLQYLRLKGIQKTSALGEA
jgi:hypothetical protein